MNARTHALSEIAVTDTFVFATPTDGHLRWLADALVAAGAVERVGLDPKAVTLRVSALNPSLVFVDFCSDCVTAARAAVSAMHVAFPGLQIVAVGSMNQPECALAALRAGVRDFIDLSGPVADALRVTREALENIVESTSRHGSLIALLGARVGMGVSTLAANLSVLLQRRDGARKREVLLFDLGLPAGDGTLLLNTRSDFSFVDAVRNVRRIDQTFVHTALAHHASGLSLTSLPADLAELREVSHASSIGLFNRLRAFFDQQIVDLGGFANDEFIASIVQVADEAWLVCDQCVPSMVSAVGLLDRLREHGIDPHRMRLVVNRYEPALGLAAMQIEQRLELELVATLPERRIVLGQSMNQGHLIADTMPRDAYVRALEALVTRLGGPGNKRAARVAGRAAFDSLRRLLPTSSKRS